MLEPGSPTRLPAQYRITLAISLALFLHTLLISLAPLLFQQPERQSVSVRFELVSPGSTPSSSAISSQPSAPISQEQAEPSEAPNPEADTNPETGPEDSDAPGNQPETITSTDASRDEQPSTADKQSTESPPKVTEEASTSTPSPESSGSASSRAGETAPDRPENAEMADITSITRPEEETDPYLLELTSRIARQLDKYPLPALRELEQPVRITVELHLMANGALTRASIRQPSGIDSLDQAAYRAALGASPYPEPPHSNGGKRYRVELVFSPERL